MSSMCKPICLVLSFPTPLNRTGYCSRIRLTTSLIVAMFTPIFSAPSSVAVSLPNSGSPFPLITTNLARVLRFPHFISHVKAPFMGRGSVEAYAYSFF